ncbi:MAG: recombinase family protein, partial [Gemmatimonadetes bacterium]|nr:recombinase family protein [Gemmatimonadota bacterium]
MSATNADHSSKEVSTRVSPPAGGQPGTTTRPVRYAISYARKSSTDDIAVVDQHAFNAKRAAAEGYIIPDDPKFRFSDDISGKHQSRAGLDQLRRWLAKRESPATRVYVRDMSRLSRVSQLTFFPSLVHEFSECGVEMCISTKTPTLCSYDISKSPSALGDFATDMIHGARGAEELQDITLRTTGGTRDRIGHGFFPGRAPFATQRYVADKRTGTFLAQAPVTGTLRFANSAFKLQWDQTLLPWVHHIFDRLEKGASAALVADELNEKM